MTRVATAAIGLSVFAATAATALVIDTLRQPHPADVCRVQVQDSEQRIRHALWEANRALIKQLGVAP